VRRARQQHRGDRADRDAGDQVGGEALVFIEPARRAQLVSAERTAALQDQGRSRSMRHGGLV
jgi:hypothetical protein